MDLRTTALRALAELASRGAEEARAVVSSGERHELTLDDNELSMLRTTFNTGLAMDYLRGRKRGQLSVNQLDDGAVSDAAERCAALCESGRPDDANVLAPAQPPEAFSYGPETPDLAGMCDRLLEFSDEVKRRHPSVIVRSAVLSFGTGREMQLNSNGVDFETRGASYSFSTTFLAKDGSRTSSFNYTGCACSDLSKPLIELGMVPILLGQIVEQTEPRRLPGSFIGDLVLSPDCFSGFLGRAFAPLADRPLIAGTSIYKDKLGQAIASSSLSVDFSPAAEGRAVKSFVTSDGFKAGELRLLDQGVLRSYLLSHKGSLKTGYARAPNYGEGLVVQAGSSSLEEMIAGVERGVLLCRFSGDSPNENGDFSGIAKNSYYIEDGRIRHPVTELMVAGNTAGLLRNIRALSGRRIDFGDSLVPWALVEGITISGS